MAGLTNKDIRCAYEKNPKKVGRLCPGSSIPIVHEDEIDVKNIQTLIVMPYSFIDEFLVKERKFMQDGGKMVILTPEIKEFLS